MAVTSVNERFQSRSSNHTAEEATHTRVFIVQCNSVSDGTATAINAVGVPALGDVHDIDVDAYAKSKSCQPLDSQKYVFIVNVEYSDEYFDSPLNKPTEITWSSSEATEQMFEDLSDPVERVLNSAGEPFDQLVERDSSELMATVVRNQATFDTNVFSYVNTINDDDFTLDAQTIPKGCAKMGPISISPWKQEHGIDYRIYTYPIKFKAGTDPWKKRVLDYGYEELDGEGGRKPIVNQDGIKVKKPWPLDHGSAKENATDEPAELEFVAYEEKDFSVFSFT